MKIKINDLSGQYKIINKSVNKRISSVLKHGKYILGPEVYELEDLLAKYTKSSYCITVSSGTDALLISLLAIGIKPNDEVITASFSFGATSEVLKLIGAKPVYVDVERLTGNINANKISEKITKKTKAIIAVSLYGQVSDMDEINKIAKLHGNIPVIEDASQSFGALYKNRRSCNLSLIGCTSFFPTKPLGCYGDGGAIFTNNKALYEKCKKLRIHGQKNKYNYEYIGINGRLDTIQAAVLLSKMEIFESELSKRKQIAEIYKHYLEKFNIEFIREKKDYISVYAQFTVLLKKRDKIAYELMKNGIECAIHYPKPLSEINIYDGIRNNKATPVANQLARDVLSIPFHPYLSEKMIIRIINKLVEYESKR